MSYCLVFQRSVAPPSLCSHCGRILPLGLLCVKKVTQTCAYYHLSCYEPTDRQIIDPKQQIKLERYDENDARTMQQWVSQWNCQFLMTVDTLPVQFKSKAVQSTQSSYRRVLLATFEYLDSREVEGSAALVCKNWFHTTRDNELWKTRYQAAAPFAGTHEGETYRTLLIVQLLSTCWVCHDYVPLEDIKLRCPLHQRPLCVRCSLRKAGKFLPVKDYCKPWNISPDLATCLDFPQFPYNETQCAYLSDLISAVVSYAEQRRCVLIEALLPECPRRVTEEVIRSISKFDLRDYYAGKSHEISGMLEEALIGFCGRREEDASRDNVADAFLAALRRAESVQPPKKRQSLT